jgi:bifunctional DNA-binding transcriptional regulator/antitoxin component of YhaV-PrlF toxin-antitoxin module
VIPKPVRDRLGVGPGDRVELIRRAAGPERIDPFAVFHEWGSEADEDAFADL